MQEIEKLKEIMKKRRKDIVQIGSLLRQIKQKKAYKEKSFSEFLKNMGISQRTASYYMKISELQDADKLVEEIGYTKLVVLMEVKKLDEKNLKLAKEMSVSQLKKALCKENENKEHTEELELKKELKKIIKKAKSIEVFKKVFIDVIRDLKEEE